MLLKIRMIVVMGNADHAPCGGKSPRYGKYSRFKVKRGCQKADQSQSSKVDYLNTVETDVVTFIKARRLNREIAPTP
jgi:hypothetical protein